MSETAIEASELRYSYGSVEAVRGISFGVCRGEILGFLGPNGAGKSTTIRILTGQLAPDSGTASILGREVRVDDPEAQSRMGVCFEEKNLYLSMTARENLSFFASLFGVRPDIDALLERVGLSIRDDRRVSGYSKGMRQRLMMARTLVNSPDVLFLDEPTDGLDPVSSMAIRQIIREEAGRGAAVLLTTHDMWEADELADRVAFICDGEIHARGTPDELKLQSGSRSVRLRLRSGEGSTEELALPLDAPETPGMLSELTASGRILTMHTEEATLETVFAAVTGRSLSR